MDIVFPYREHGVPLTIPEGVKVFHPAVRTPIAETYTAIIKNLLRPLGYKQTLFDLAKTCKSGCVVADAFCPPQVNRQILDPVIKTLHAAGMSHDDITILVTSEYPSEFQKDQVNALFDDAFLTEYNVQPHDVFAYTQHELIGTTSSGTPVYIDRRLKNADIKIITGGIYPHYLFGYAGAPLLLTFGISGPETIQALYNLADLDHLDEFNLLNQNSKFNKELLEITSMTQLDFIVNISIDSSLRFVDIFSGKPTSVIKKLARDFTEGEHESIPEKSDVVISCTGRSHCEMSWYHNLMSICFSRSFLHPKGTIIFVTPMFDQYSAAKLSKIKKKTDLIDLFSLNKIINTTQDKMFSCVEKGTIIFISPKLENKSLKAPKDRDVFFCSSIDDALAFATEQMSDAPHTLLLPDGLLTFISMAS